MGLVSAGPQDRPAVGAGADGREALEGLGRGRRERPRRRRSEGETTNQAGVARLGERDGAAQGGGAAIEGGAAFEIADRTPLASSHAATPIKISCR